MRVSCSEDERGWYNKPQPHLDTMLDEHLEGVINDEYSLEDWDKYSMLLRVDPDEKDHTVRLYSVALIGCVVDYNIASVAYRSRHFLTRLIMFLLSGTIGCRGR